MRVLLFAAWVAIGPMAVAQPLPDTLRSAGLTQAQADELNRRLATLQQRFGALARETNLREAAVRNIAIEIFGADPNLDFETYAALIDIGARELRTYLTDARARSDPDPAAAAIRQRAIDAAEDGRLSEARALYDQLIAANRDARQRARHVEDLADAADMAEAGWLASIAFDYRGAARRYGEAAELAPEGSLERLQYTDLSAIVLSELRALDAIHRMLAQIEGRLTLTDRDDDPASWARLQRDRGFVLVMIAERGEPREFERAAAALEAALTVLTREGDPEYWAHTQYHLARAYRGLGRRADAREAAQRAHETYEQIGDRVEGGWAYSTRRLLEELRLE